VTEAITLENCVKIQLLCKIDMVNFMLLEL